MAGHFLSEIYTRSLIEVSKNGGRIRNAFKIIQQPQTIEVDEPGPFFFQLGHVFEAAEDEKD